MPKFSIIVPVYNVEKYLETCIESILKQSYNNYEIILVNDGSTDKSGDICNQYEDKYNCIKVVHQKNQGLSIARNTGLEHSTGEYLVFVDSDDWLTEGALEKASKIIEENLNPEIVVNRIESYYNDTKSHSECKYKFEIEKMKNMNATEIFKVCQGLPEFWMAAWIFIVNREFLEKNELQFSKGLLHEDEEWSPRLILNANKIAFNNDCFYCNRADRTGSITSTKNIKKEFDKLKIIDILETESKKNKYDLEKKTVLLSRCSSLYAGVIGKLPLYKGDSNYKMLVEELKGKKKVLLYSNKRTHKIIYTFSKSLGVKLTSQMMKVLGR